MTFADRLEELRKAATPGPWRVAEHRTHGLRCFAKRITLTPETAKGDIANVIAGLGSLDTNTDAELICFLANNADAILELVRAAEPALESLEYAIRSMDERSYREMIKGQDSPQKLKAREAFKNALSKLNGEQT